jgi:hypothetical protein
MKITKAKNRDKKRHKRKHGMRIGSKSVFVIAELAVLEAERIAARNKRKRQRNK